MPDVTIASFKWRRETDDFAPLCDNKLTLNTTTGRAGMPTALNSFGICEPACELCVTPYAKIGNFRDDCALFGFLKTSQDDVVRIPNQWDVTCEGGPFT